MPAHGPQFAAPPPRRPPPPVTVIVGEEELLVERAVAQILAAAARRAAGRRPVALTCMTCGRPTSTPGDSPPHRAVPVRRRLPGGGPGRAGRGQGRRGRTDPVRGRPRRLTWAGAHPRRRREGQGAAGQPDEARAPRVIECPAVKRFGERLDFVRAEFRRAGRKADEAAAAGAARRGRHRTCGSWPRRAASSPRDTTGVIDQAVVARYYRGRAEATGFTVADRAVEGKLAEALEQLRWALATGRVPGADHQRAGPGGAALGRVGARPRGAGAPRRWPPSSACRRGRSTGSASSCAAGPRTGVARALQAVAEADAQVKGEGASAGLRPGAGHPPIVACRAAEPLARLPARADARARHANGPQPAAASPAERSACWSSAARLAMADLRFAAWFLWMTPLLAALSSCRQAARSAASASSASPASAASRNWRTERLAATT